MREIRNTVVAILIALVGFGTIATPSSVSAQNSAPHCIGDILDCAEGLFRQIGEGEKCVAMYGVEACAHAWDALTWARDITIWKFPESTDGDMGNAFKHCSWAGAMATRVGADDAFGIAYIHEDFTKNEAKNRKMDVGNNFIGSQIGDEAVKSGTSDTWGYVMDECESRARDGLLYGPCGVVGSYKPPYLPAEDITSCSGS